MENYLKQICIHRQTIKPVRYTRRNGPARVLELQHSIWGGGVFDIKYLKNYSEFLPKIWWARGEDANEYRNLIKS